LPDLDDPTLADLIDNLAVTKAAAEAACTALSECEEKYRDADGNLASVATPRSGLICGPGWSELAPKALAPFPKTPIALHAVGICAVCTQPKMFHVNFP
jgi:hypothetical protein